MQEPIGLSSISTGENKIPEPSAPGILAEFRGWLKDILLAVVIAFLMVVFLYQPVKVEGTSMQPELLDQERIFVNKFVYHFEEIHRGDIVVFWYPKDPEQVLYQAGSRCARRSRFDSRRSGLYQWRAG